MSAQELIFTFANPQIGGAQALLPPSALFGSVKSPFGPVAMTFVGTKVLVGLVLITLAVVALPRGDSVIFLEALN